ncbi:helix-turn-helix domain-containing protein [Deinococcus rubellus]|uniref:helix-turn-helix domain-containing protein n=1 Tax=Deinococcus rubellus TaxID=1889240 RepID=UPI0031E66494
MTQPLVVHLPSEQDRQLARAALARLAGDAHSDVRLEDLPSSVGDLVQRLLSEIAQGHAVQLLPVEAELRTQEAAELLGISRPHLVKLLDEGQLPSWKVGTHRRIRLDDVLTYREQRMAARLQALQELADLDQALGLL